MEEIFWEVWNWFRIWGSFFWNYLWLWGIRRCTFRRDQRFWLIWISHQFFSHQTFWFKNLSWKLGNEFKTKRSHRLDGVEVEKEVKIKKRNINLTFEFSWGRLLGFNFDSNLLVPKHAFCDLCPVNGNSASSGNIFLSKFGDDFDWEFGCVFNFCCASQECVLYFQRNTESSNKPRLMRNAKGGIMLQRMGFIVSSPFWRIHICCFLHCTKRSRALAWILGFEMNREYQTNKIAKTWEFWICFRGNYEGQKDYWFRWSYQNYLNSEQRAFSVTLPSRTWSESSLKLKYGKTKATCTIIPVLLIFCLLILEKFENVQGLRK